MLWFGHTLKMGMVQAEIQSRLVSLNTTNSYFFFASISSIITARKSSIFHRNKRNVRLVNWLAQFTFDDDKWKIKSNSDNSLCAIALHVCVCVYRFHPITLTTTNDCLLRWFFVIFWIFFFFFGVDNSSFNWNTSNLRCVTFNSEIEIQKYCFLFQA